MADQIFLTHQVAQATGRHPNTIRNYCYRGLITEPQRRWDGVRLFNNDHIAQIKKIKPNRGAKKNG